MPHPAAGVVGGNSWFAAPPAAAYEIGLYCARATPHAVSWLREGKYLPLRVHLS